MESVRKNECCFICFEKKAARKKRLIRRIPGTREKRKNAEFFDVCLCRKRIEGIKTNKMTKKGNK